MVNHSWRNGENNHQNAYFGFSSEPQESSEMRFAMNWSHWTSEEQAILDDGLIRYSSESRISRYAKIASGLQNKTIRDVAMRCRWLYKKETNKRRKENHNGSGRVRTDNREITDMVVASNSVPHLFATPPTVLREEDGMTNELLRQNEQFLNQISENLTSLKLAENLMLFYQTRENIRKLLKNMNENVPEPMKHMPPLPETLSDDLADSILHPSNLP